MFGRSHHGILAEFDGWRVYTCECPFPGSRDVSHSMSSGSFGSTMHQDNDSEGFIYICGSWEKCNTVINRYGVKSSCHSMFSTYLDVFVADAVVDAIWMDNWLLHDSQSAGRA